MDKLAVKVVAKRYRVTANTVLDWIHCGDLAAVNVAKTVGGKPQWRITEAALEAFEMLRTPEHPPPPGTRRKRQPAGEVKDYF